MKNNEETKTGNRVFSELSQNDRLDAALAVAAEAFKCTDLTLDDIEKAVKSLRIKRRIRKRTPHFGDGEI